MYKNTLHTRVIEKYILKRVDNATGTTTYYGPFVSEISALEWADDELPLHNTYSDFTVLTLVCPI